MRKVMKTSIVFLVVSVILAFLITPTNSYAQTTISNPSTVTFTKSADHDVLTNGSAVVSNYEVRLYQKDTTTWVNSLSIGKPVPDATGTITFASLQTVYTAAPLGDYVVRIAAVGPGGAAESLPSDPFTVAMRKPTAPTGKPAIK